jgi:hypothetical protein
MNDLLFDFARRGKENYYEKDLIFNFFSKNMYFNN